MTATEDSLRGDIAFLRAMAEAGRDIPSGSGPWLLVPGVLYAGASFLCFGMLRGWIPGAAAIFWVWAGAMALQILSLPLLARIAPRSVSAAGRAISAIWKATGFAILTCFICWSVYSWYFQTGAAWMLFPSLALAFYGASWSASASIAGLRWLHIVAFLSCVGAIAAVPLSGSSMLFLFYGVILLAVVAWPGWRLMVAAKRS